MDSATTRPASGRWRPPRVHTSAILTAFAGALLASTPSSDAFQAWTPALPPQALPITPAVRRPASDASAPSATASGMRRPSTPRCAAPGAVCSGSNRCVSRRRSRRNLLLMSGAGGEEGVEGEALADGEELGVVVEGVASISREASRAGGEESQDTPTTSAAASVMSSSSSSSSSNTEGDQNGPAAVEAATKPGKIKKAKKKTKGTMKAKANKPPRLQGKALRDELMRREKREEARVLAVNTLFYRARAYNEIEDLKRVWDKSELSECIRSVGGALKGYDNIVEEYETDFVLAQKQEKPGMRPFKIKNVKVQTCGTLAWVTCIEDMRNPYKPYPKTVQLVTNVFRKTSNGWRLTRHHASDRDVATVKSSGGKHTLKAARELPGGGSSLLHNFVDKTGGVTELSARLFRVVNGEMRPFDLDFDSSDDNDDDDDDDDDDSDEQEEEDITDQIGREIASQIFLNYGDVFEDGKEGSGGEGITEIPLGEISFTSSGKAGGGDSLDETIPPAMRKRIEEAMLDAKLKERRGEANQRFQNIYNLNEGLKEVTREAEAASAKDEKDVEWGDLGSSGKEWASASSSNSSSGGGGGGGDGDGDGDGESGKNGEKEDKRGGVATRESRDLTRKTVDAVRILADMGRINDKEKGMLLADVFRNASSAGPSVTEAAYSLLLDGEVTPEGMEYTHKADEFAEQCKAITLQLDKQQNSNRRWWWKFWAKPQWWRFWTREE
eukprot:g18481.t1